MHHSKSLTPLWRLLPLLVAVTVLTGCAGTFGEVKPLSTSGGGGPVTPTARHVTSLLIGEIKITDARIAKPEAETFAFAVRRGIANWNLAHHGFNAVADLTATTALSPGSVVLTATIHEVEKGNLALRMLVGMGAGQASIVGDFKFGDDAANSLGGFTARRSYLGGAGAGGADLLTTEELFVRLGEEVAESADKWARGEKVQ